MLSVAIQGIAGSFHQEAAEKFFKSQLSLIECHSFREVFEAVQAGKADYGIVAVENSLHGSINAVYRLLSTQKLWVCGEVRLKIEQYLIGPKPIKENDLALIQKVYSQAPALEQCENWLESNLSAELIETHDTADSVKRIVQQDNQALAAVASKKAAQIYGGTIIAGPINDDPNNYTRFFVITKHETDSTDSDRTSIIMTENSADEAGSLYAALGHFKNANINLSKLDSHPLPGEKRRYSFYIDFDANIKNPDARSVIKNLISDGWSVNILGSYKTWHN